jgi:hypothetical protein
MVSWIEPDSRILPFPNLNRHAYDDAYFVQQPVSLCDDAMTFPTGGALISVVDDAPVLHPGAEYVACFVPLPAVHVANLPRSDDVASYGDDSHQRLIFGYFDDQLLSFGGLETSLFDGETISPIDDGRKMMPWPSQQLVRAESVLAFLQPLLGSPSIQMVSWTQPDSRPLPFPNLNRYAYDDV